VINTDVVATAVPLSATKSASIATAIAGDMRPSTFRKTVPPFGWHKATESGETAGQGVDRRFLLRPSARSAPWTFSGV
jgi:hypothetical protein